MPEVEPAPAAKITEQTKNSPMERRSQQILQMVTTLLHTACPTFANRVIVIAVDDGGKLNVNFVATSDSLPERKLMLEALKMTVQNLEESIVEMEAAQQSAAAAKT